MRGAFLLSILVLVTGIWSTMPNIANAACVGGSEIKGGYSITIQGQLEKGGTEALAGVIHSNGESVLTGKFYGIYSKTSVNASGATGAYSINSDLSGTLEITIGKQATRSFVVNLATNTHEISGLENDGTAEASLDAHTQGLSKFSQSSVSGKFTAIDGLVDKPLGELDLVSYNGTGGGSFSQNCYCVSTYGILTGGTGTIEYTVNSDGSYTEIYIDGGGNQFMWGGGIDSSGATIRIAFISVTPSRGPGGITPDINVIQKQ